MNVALVIEIYVVIVCGVFASDQRVRRLTENRTSGDRVTRDNRHICHDAANGVAHVVEAARQHAAAPVEQG